MLMDWSDSMREDGFNYYNGGKTESLATPSKKCYTTELKKKKCLASYLR